MEKDKLLIALKDISGEVREIEEIQEMLTEISEIVDRYGFTLPVVDIGVTVVLPGKIQNARIETKFQI